MSQSVQLSVRELFITRLFTYQLSLAEHHASWIARIDELRASDPQGGGQRSVRHGWKNTFKLFEDPLFNPLYQQAQQCFHHTLAQMGADLALRFQLEGSVNITDVGGYNQHHGHAQNMLSGCYYLSMPEYSGGIEFHEPRLGAKYSPFQPKSLYGSQSLVVQPQEGQLIIFPCWLEHSVQENLSSQSRYSIPMNLKPRQLV